MQTLLYVELNIFALIVLLLIFLNNYHRTEIYLTEQILFLGLIITNALIIIFDSAMWILDGKPGELNRIIYLVATALYYCFNPLICMVWAFYADYQIYRNDIHSKKIAVPLILPVVFNAVLSIMSIFNGSLFYIDENNVYHRGKFFIIMFAISYFYLLYSFILIMVKQKSVEKRSYYSILLFVFAPFLGGLVQTLVPGISIIWVCTTVSILIIFINIQNNQLYTDHLTGLYNRRQLDYYLSQKIQNSNNSCALAGIMIDIDSFKMINDIYGHTTGDAALESMASILKASFGKNHFIARYGGDEFVVILETRDRDELSDYVKQLEKELENFNLQKKMPFMLKFSVGYDVFNCEDMLNEEKFLKHIDNLMYRDKTEKKSGLNPSKDSSN